MEGAMVVSLAGRCAEKLVFGEAEVWACCLLCFWRTRWCCLIRSFLLPFTRPPRKHNKTHTSNKQQMTGLGTPDLFHANMIAREMVLSAGMGRKVGPMDLMRLHAPSNDNGSMLRSLEPRERGDETHYYQATDMSTEMVCCCFGFVCVLLVLRLC
jgi:hypothetical protein